MRERESRNCYLRVWEFPTLGQGKEERRKMTGKREIAERILLIFQRRCVDAKQKAGDFWNAN